MGGVTVERTSSIIEMLELYSARLSALRAEMLAIHQEVENLATDFAISLDAARTAAECALTAAELPPPELTPAADALASSDPEIGTEIEIFSEDTTLFDRTGTIDAEQRTDDLTGIDGIDDTAAETLSGFGIHTYSDLARIDDDEAIAIGMVLGDADRVSRECWVEQAAVMAQADDRREPAEALAEAVIAHPIADIDDASDVRSLPRQATAVTIDPIFEDMVLEQDPTTRQLIMAAASLAQAIAAQKERERSGAAQSAEIISLPPPAATATGSTKTAAASEPSKPTLGPTTTGAEVIDIAARRVSKSPTKRRPRAIAASLLMLLLTGVAVGASGEHLGFDMTTLTNCGEALLHGDTTCVDLPASIL